MNFTIKKRKGQIMGDVRQFPNGSQPPPGPFKEIQVTMRIPHDFHAVGYIVTAINKEGQSFTDGPFNQPHLALLLAIRTLDYAGQLAGQKLQEYIVKESPILKPPPGMSLPPFPGPEGRG